MNTLNVVEQGKSNKLYQLNAIWAQLKQVTDGNVYPELHQYLVQNRTLHQSYCDHFKDIEMEHEEHWFQTFLLYVKQLGMSSERRQHLLDQQILERMTVQELNQLSDIILGNNNNISNIPI